MPSATNHFKSILLQYCTNWKRKARTLFDDFHVDEALDEAEQRNLEPKALAGLVLWKCCCANGKFNNASIVFLAVVKFLTDHHGDIGEQPFLDLGAMLKEGTTEEAIQKWVETHYD
jgi:hypothetical protein